MGKRRRVEVSPEDTIVEDTTEQDLLDKENDIWLAFKDEHVEVFDLQSSLPRKYGLVRELAVQDEEQGETLLTSLMKYIELRRTEPSHTCRDGLAQIAQLAETWIHTREEKVNQTRAAFELVERCVRLIDHAITEQDHAIKLGTRPGTHFAPPLQPELVIPRWAKPPRVSLSPDLDEALGGTPQPLEPARKKGRKRGRKKAESFSPQPRPDPPYIPNPDPNEKRYCYCDQVSFGEMIACDDARCQREWFHLSCTSLKAPPEGRKKWFCDECMLRKKQRKG
ncbi:PHD-type domain-containing protein [Mycena indigotica]|uniref:PHD-type domain-containing protein n=1 Tax=Mycena indigotica TaxID=2126181 RepID=A0A8H6S8Y7_9AGAR|nr:PHD-type domain-containing protein [Mycena indigotica]KAF7295190.1 PHD-type domain-containing protein [Mycena indigotica]